MPIKTDIKKKLTINAAQNVKILSINPKFSITEISKYYKISRQGVHKKLREKNIKSIKSNYQSYLTHSEARKFFDFKFDPKVIGIQIVKGGVGKTTLTQSIATCASLYGARILCIDLDQQGNLTRSFNYDASNSPIMIDLLKEHINIKDAIIKITDGIDLLPSRLENANLDNVLITDFHYEISGSNV